MTAGRGIVHSEMPASDGVQKGLQLWINLASKDKMYVVSYTDIPSDICPMIWLIRCSSS
jgi:redox-sensitive bicupin YhaK (pirin superfamily)